MAVGEPASVTADLYSRLRAIVAGREAVDVAQLHFVGLDKVQKAYGGRWPEHQIRIHDAAESFLRKRIGASDLLVRGEGGFLVVLGGSTGPDSHAAAAQLAHGLNAFFTGDMDGNPAPRFGGLAQSIPTKDLEQSLVRASKGDLASSDYATGAAGPAELDWKFEPVWDVKREALSYWYVTPFRADTGARVAGYQFETGAVNADQYLRIDEDSLWLSEQTLEEASRSRKQALVGVTLHIQSLASLASRARIFATLARLDPSLHRFRLVKIAGVPTGFPRIYLNEIIGALRSRLPNIVLLANWDEPDVQSLLHPGLSGIGFMIPGSGVMSGPLTSVPALMYRTGEAMRLAHGARMRFFVEGAVTKFLALKFARSGVDNIASESIWPARVPADGIQKWPADRLAAA
jgi:hypothetical protein